MKGIYLTQEGKKDIENRIVSLEKHIPRIKEILSLTSEDIGTAYLEIELKTKLSVYKKILSSAIILPTQKSWDHFELETNMFDKLNLKFMYDKGVAIKPTTTYKFKLKNCPGYEGHTPEDSKHEFCKHCGNIHYYH